MKYLSLRSVLPLTSFAAVFVGIVLAGPACDSAAAAEWRAELRDSLENLFPDSKVSDAPCTSTTVDVARGGTAAVHVLLNGLKPGAPVEFDVRLDGAPVAGAEWCRLVDVPVEHNTGMRGSIEEKRGPNPHVVRRAPFRAYDAMAPVQTPVKAPAETMALRLHLPVARDAAGGSRSFQLRLASDERRRGLEFLVRVHPVEIPRIGPDSFNCTIWYSPDQMASRHQLEPWSEPHWEMIARYARLMARARQNTFLIPMRKVLTVQDGRIVLNAERLGRLVKTFSDAGMHYIEGSCIGKRSKPSWNCPTFAVAFTGNLSSSPAGEADIASIGRQLSEEIQRNNWQKRWLQHIADEPVDKNAEDYKRFAAAVRKHMPGVRIIEAVSSRSLVGAVDIWCLNTTDPEKERDFLDARRAAGDGVWFYTAVGPGGPYLNRLIDMELLRPALFGWVAVLYNFDGYLHWALNVYIMDDPFNQTIVRDVGFGMVGAPGGTHIVYPGPDGPWSSLRLEAQREGLEDCELLRMLRRRDAEAADKLVREVVTGFGEYTLDLAKFRATRRRLLAALSR